MGTKSAALEQARAGAGSGRKETQAGTPAGPLAIVMALLALYVIWGSTYLAIRIGVETIPPFMMAGVRFIIAGGLMYLFLRWRGHAAPTRAEWRGAFLVGSLLLVGGNGLVTFAEQWVPSGLAALGVATTPLWAALFAGIWGRWPMRLEWLGLAVGFVGAVLLNLEGDMQANPLGALALLLAAMSWAFGSIWSGRLPMPTGFMASAAQMLAGGVVLSGLSLVTGERLKVTPSTESLLAVLYLIIFGAIIAYTAYGFLLRTVRPSLATSYAYVNPLVAVGLGLAAGDGRITWLGFAAMVVILSSVGVLALVRGQGPGSIGQGAGGREQGTGGRERRR